MHWMSLTFHGLWAVKNPILPQKPTWLWRASSRTLAHKNPATVPLGGQERPPFRSARGDNYKARLGPGWIRCGWTWTHTDGYLLGPGKQTPSIVFTHSYKSILGQPYPYQLLIQVWSLQIRNKCINKIFTRASIVDTSLSWSIIFEL